MKDEGPGVFPKSYCIILKCPWNEGRMCGKEIQITRHNGTNPPALLVRQKQVLLMFLQWVCLFSGLNVKDQIMAGLAQI